jgi:hypothetical protein
VEEGRNVKRGNIIRKVQGCAPAVSSSGITAGKRATHNQIQKCIFRTPAGSRHHLQAVTTSYGTQVGTEY